jgi:hypothetical protein
MKKFFPLPPVRKSQQEPLIHIQEPLSDSISEAEGEISAASTSVLESISVNHHSDFSFENFHSVIVPINSMEAVKLSIKGCIIKIGELSCFLSRFTMEEHCDYASPFSLPTS